MDFSLFRNIDFNTVIVILLVFLLTAFFVVYTIISKRAYKNLLDSLNSEQEKNITKSAELLACALRDYTDTTLVERVHEKFDTFFSNDLLPAVNESYNKLSSLSEIVVERQEAGMTELAKLLADLLAEKTRDYIIEETRVISELKETASFFSNELSSITEAAKTLYGHYGYVYENSEKIFSMLNETASVMVEKMASLSDLVHDVTLIAEKNQNQIRENIVLMSELSDTTRVIQESYKENTLALSEQNKEAALIAQAHSSSITSAVSAFSSTLELYVSKFNEVSDRINNSIKEFNENAEESSSRFEVGMETSVREALELMDSSLAEIVKRLISVTDSIQDAADSLPGAVKAMIQNR